MANVSIHDELIDRGYEPSKRPIAPEDFEGTFGNMTRGVKLSVLESFVILPAFEVPELDFPSENYVLYRKKA